MIEKYKTLSLAQLRELAKAQGVKNTSIMRKAQLAQILSDLEEKLKQEKNEDAEKTTVEDNVVPTETAGTSEKTMPSEKSVISEKAMSSEKPVASEKMMSSEKTAAAGRAVQIERATARASESKNGFVPKTEKVFVHRAEQERQFKEEVSRETAERVSVGGSAGDEAAERPQEREERPERSQEREERQERPQEREDRPEKRPNLEELDSGQMADGILEVMPDGFGFIRCENYLPGDNDIYVSPAQIRRFNLKTGDIIEGNIKIKTPTEKFSALLYVRKVNGFPPAEAAKRKNFEDMTPIFPNSRIRLENPRATVPMRIVDLVSPIGKGQRGMIVSPPKTGKTTLLKQIAKSINYNHPDMNMIILLIDERPEEVTDIKEYIEGENVEVIYSTFDELPEHHKRVSEMVLERAKRLVEHKKDVVILLDSITRLARAYNLTVPPSGRTLSGGLDPAALYMPKRFFGAARNMREGGSLTVLATALVETGSKMDDVIFEEFKGTGNMELVLDRKLSEKRIFPAIDIPRSGTRREELLLNREEMDAMYLMRKALNGMKSDEALEHILDMFMRTRSNRDFIANIKRTKMI